MDTLLIGPIVISTVSLVVAALAYFTQKDRKASGSNN